MPSAAYSLKLLVWWVLAETDDLKKVYEWTTQWSDLLEFTVVPVLEDAELGEVLSKLA